MPTGVKQKEDAAKNIEESLIQLEFLAEKEGYSLGNNFRKLILEHLKKHRLTIPVAHALIADKIADKAINLYTMYNFLLRNKTISLENLSYILDGLGIKINLEVEDI